MVVGLPKNNGATGGVVTVRGQQGEVALEMVDCDIREEEGGGRGGGCECNVNSQVYCTTCLMYMDNMRLPRRLG